MNDYSHHFRSLVEAQLSNDPRVLVPDVAPNMIILANWRLSTDPLRPNKRSRLIRIVISQEALEDYASGSNGIRLAGDDRFTVWLRHQLRSFDPDHGLPPGNEPPAVTWEVSTRVLNG